MKKVILFGATGNLGKEIARELVKQGYDLTVVIRNKNKFDQLSGITNQHIIANVSKPHSLKGICKNYEIVVSALGKSVSPNDKSKATFQDIDFVANSSILQEAIEAKVQKFVYVSALHAERYQHLEYFRVHHEFSEKLQQSKLNYSIIKPPAIFSAYADMMSMARKGRLVTIGTGDRKTNPIFEGDLAKVCVDAIGQNNAIVEAGGKNLYTRKQLNEIIQKRVAPHKKVRSVPLGLFKFSLPLIKIIDGNAYDKFSFFAEVIQHDTIAPQVGEMKFEDYINMRAKGIL